MYSEFTRIIAQEYRPRLSVGEPHMVEPVIEQLKSLILELNPNVTSGQLHDDASIVEDLGLDSIVVVNLISLIEERFSFVFEEEDLNMDTFSTIRVLADFIDSRPSNGQGTEPDHTDHRPHDERA